MVGWLVGWLMTIIDNDDDWLMMTMTIPGSSRTWRSSCWSSVVRRARRWRSCCWPTNCRTGATRPASAWRCQRHIGLSSPTPVARSCSLKCGWEDCEAADMPISRCVVLPVIISPPKTTRCLYKNGPLILKEYRWNYDRKYQRSVFIETTCSFWWWNNHRHIQCNVV